LGNCHRQLGILPPNVLTSKILLARPGHLHGNFVMINIMIKKKRRRRRKSDRLSEVKRSDYKLLLL
jgi:hypothetical protein